MKNKFYHRIPRKLKKELKKAYGETAYQVFLKRKFINKKFGGFFDDHLSDKYHLVRRNDKGNWSLNFDELSNEIKGDVRGLYKKINGN